MRNPYASMVEQTLVAIKGAGEMATGVAVRLHRAGFRRILMLETESPLAVRRAVSMCEAVHDGRQEVEGVSAVRVDDVDALSTAWLADCVAVAVDPGWTWLRRLSPTVSVDAVLAKRNLGTRIGEARLVIALGPGFVAGEDAHYVVETNRGHDLGRVIVSGSAEPNTGVPGDIGGYTIERVLRAPGAGVVESCRAIGDTVAAGEAVCAVDGVPVPARIAGVVRGCVRPGTWVEKGTKLGDVDPRGRRENCFTVSEKARALGGSVLEAICGFLFG